MDGRSYFTQAPRRPVWQQSESPWGMRYGAESVDPLVQPFTGGSFGRAGRHGGIRPDTQPNSPRVSVNPRRIIVRDLNEERKEQSKQESPASRKDVGEPKLARSRFEGRDEDAASYIQRRYRGHRVRSVSPLRQLRVIRDVRDRYKEFQEMACKPEFLEKARANKMEQLKFEESIMKEVLKLDSLEGVLPGVRDLRKATARDLLKLQDVVDEALASGGSISPDDLKFVDTPTDSGNEDDEGDATDAGIHEVTIGGDESPSRLDNESPSRLDNESFSRLDNERAAVGDDVALSVDEEKEGPGSREDVGGRGRRDASDNEAETDAESKWLFVDSEAAEARKRWPSAVLDPSTQQHLGTCAAADSEMAVPDACCCGEEPSVTIPCSADAEAAVPDLLSACREYYVDSAGREPLDTGARADNAEQDRKSNPTDDSSLEKMSRLEMLHLLRKENQQVRDLMESALKLQALTISSLNDRVARLEQQVSRCKAKAVSSSSCRKSRAKLGRDVEDA